MKFKVGDTVVLIKHDSWTKKGNYILNNVYIVDEADPISIRCSGMSYIIKSIRFILASEYKNKEQNYEIY